MKSLGSVVPIVFLFASACRAPGSAAGPIVLECRASGAPASADVRAGETVAPRAELSFPAPAGPAPAELALVAAQGAGGERWQWRLVPYLFAANLDGKLSVGSTEVSTDVSFSDLVQSLDFGGMLFFEGQRGRWGFAIDSAYMDLGEDGKGPAGVTREADVKMGILGAEGLWRVTPTSPFELALGLRYLDVKQELTVGPVSADGDSQILDGIVGGRATWPFAERWRFALYGDVGTGDSDLTWQALANLGYDFEHWGLNLGYRILDYNFQDGSKELDVALEGWLFGVEFRF